MNAPVDITASEPSTFRSTLRTILCLSLENTAVDCSWSSVVLPFAREGRTSQSNDRTGASTSGTRNPRSVGTHRSVFFRDPSGSVYSHPTRPFTVEREMVAVARRGALVIDDAPYVEVWLTGSFAFVGSGNTTFCGLGSTSSPFFLRGSLSALFPPEVARRGRFRLVVSRWHSARPGVSTPRLRSCSYVDKLVFRLVEVVALLAGYVKLTLTVRITSSIYGSHVNLFIHRIYGRYRGVTLLSLVVVVGSVGFPSRLKPWASSLLLCERRLIGTARRFLSQIWI